MHNEWKTPELYPPSDPLQKRLGWAVTTEPPWYNAAVLEWMAESAGAFWTSDTIGKGSTLLS